MAATPAAAAPRRTPAWRARLATFWRWWTGELAAAVPERLAALGGNARIPTVVVEDGEVVLVEPRSAAGPDARVAIDQLDAPRRSEAVRSLLQRAGETRGRARVALGRGEALVRRATMPAATEENLRQVLEFEMDRLTPFRAEDVYFDDRVVGRDPAAGTVSLMLAVAPRRLVDDRVAAMRAMGVSVQGVTVMEDVAVGGAGALDLLPSEQRGERETAAERTLRAGLAVALLVLLTLVLVWPIWRKREAVIAVMPQTTKAAADAQATDNLARELERQVADYNFLLGKKHGGLPALAYVEDVSRLLPDNTWVQQFDLKQAGKTREVQITGETVSSSKLIEVLQQSQLLQNPETRGTVTRGSQAGTERFMLAATVKPRPAPEPRPVLEGMDAAAPGKAPAAAPQPPQAAPQPAPQPAPATPPAQPPVPAKVQPVPPAASKAAPPKPAPGK